MSKLDCQIFISQPSEPSCLSSLGYRHVAHAKVEMKLGLHFKFHCVSCGSWEAVGMQLAEASMLKLVLWYWRWLCFQGRDRGICNLK